MMGTLVLHRFPASHASQHRVSTPHCLSGGQESLHETPVFLPPVLALCWTLAGHFSLMVRLTLDPTTNLMPDFQVPLQTRRAPRPVDNLTVHTLATAKPAELVFSLLPGGRPLPEATDPCRNCHCYPRTFLGLIVPISLSNPTIMSEWTWLEKEMGRAVTTS